jgi:hypothetical protein
MARKRRHQARAERRGSVRRQLDLIRRLTELEEWVRANRRELELQFQRMAQMQADIERLKHVQVTLPSRRSR